MTHAEHSSGALIVDRVGASATGLADGSVLLWGGHRAVVLADDTVLVTGGVHATGAQLSVIADAELFDPRGDADPFGRAPASVAVDDEGLPIATCVIVD